MSHHSAVIRELDKLADEIQSIIDELNDIAHKQDLVHEIIN